MPSDEMKARFKHEVKYAHVRLMAKSWSLHVRRDCHGLCLPIPDEIIDKLEDSEVQPFFDYLVKFGLTKSKETYTYGKWYSTN